MPKNNGYGLVRVKRNWVPDWLWRVFCIGNLATFFPWNVVLTRKAVASTGEEK